MKVPVLIPRIFDHPHTYLSKKFGKLKTGSIVSVPFGNEEEIGVVWDKEENTNKNFKLKYIKEKKPVSLSDNLVKFINWFSLYNLAPKGMVLKMCLGDESFFSKKKETFDKSLKIEHSPRIRNDISKIYFLLDYDFGKTIVPIVRNYAFGIDFYSSSEILHGASDLNKLVDFENLNTPLSNELLKKIQKEKNIESIGNELEKLLIEDFLLIEMVYQNNFFEKNLTLNTSAQNIQNNNKCIKRNFSVSRISSVELSSLP